MDVQKGGDGRRPNSAAVIGPPVPRRSPSWFPWAGTIGAMAPSGAVISKYLCQFDS